MPPVFHSEFVDYDAYIQQQTVQTVRYLQDDGDWLSRVQIDAEEHIRQLSNPAKCEQALKTLNTFPFDDLINPVSIAQELLSISHNTPNILDLLRKSIYAVLRKYIRSERTPAITKLINNLEAVSEKYARQDRFNAELDLCATLLTLIPSDAQTLKQLDAILHPEATKKSSIKMIRQVIESYASLGIQWRKKWFPVILRIEEYYEKVMRKQEGLMDLKDYIYVNFHVDWRVMVIAFDCLQRIIFNNVSEDVRNSAYWEKMSKKKRIKISNFADPTPLMNMQAQYSPFLNTPSRDAAVRFLIAMTQHPDEEIANDAKDHISRYSRIEKAPSILVLYDNFQQQKPLTQSNIEFNGFIDTPEQSFQKIIGCLHYSKLPMEVIQQLVQRVLPNHNAQEYFNIDHNFGTPKSSFHQDFFVHLTDHEKLETRKKAIFHLSSLLHFQPRRPTTWKNTRLLIEQITHQLECYPEEHLPYELKEHIQKIVEFYNATKSNEAKLKFYNQLLKRLDTKAQEEKRVAWKAPNLPQLSSSDYQDYFERWKKDHNLESISVESFVFKDSGHPEFTFKVKPVDGECIRFKTFHDEKCINIELLDTRTDVYETLIKKHRLPSYQNTFTKLNESIKKVIKKGYVEKEDSTLVVDYFEELLCSRLPTIESISISAIAFVSQFGFTLNGYCWGLPTLEELQEILDIKLRLSYLSHVYGSEHTESAFVNYCDQQINTGKLALIPLMPFLPQDNNGSNPVVEFYNLILQRKELPLQVISPAYSNVLDHLKEFTKPNKILYECSLAFQRVLSQNIRSVIFSVNRTSIYLTTILERLSKTKICDLKLFIQSVLVKTSHNLGKNKYHNSLKLIESFNKIIRIIFPTNELSETDSQKIRSILSMLTFLYQEILKDYQENSRLLHEKTQATFLKTLCEFYALCYYYKNTWSSFQPHVANVINISYKSTTASASELIQILMKSIVKFYILNRNHSNELINTLRNFLNQKIDNNDRNKRFLMEMTDVICSHSLILWNTGLQECFSNIFLNLINIFETSYTNQDAKQLIEILNTTTLIKQYLSPAQLSAETKTLNDRVNKILEKAKNDTIELYIVPAWTAALNESDPHPLRNILKSISVNVKEDNTFLEALEAAYQKLIFANTTNPYNLQDIYNEISTRFNHTPVHKKLKGRLLSTYKPDGSLFEEKYAYDILAVLFGVDDSGLSYLRLEDNRPYFLSALIRPVQINGRNYITGFGGGGKMKMKVNRHGVPDNALLPQIDVKEITEGKFGKLLESVRFKEAYYYWQRMFNPTSLDGDVIVGTFKVMYVDPGTVILGCTMPHDGLGVISARVLGQFKRQLDYREPYSVRIPIQTYQAVQHNKESTDPKLFDATINECVQQSAQGIEEYLSANQSDQSSVKDLYSRLITGGISNGRNFVAIPATGENHIILPLPVKQHDVWLGKTPYEKTSNVLLRHEDQISHLRSDDPHKRAEAVQLSKLTGFQYSFTATNGSALIFNKGILVVIPEELWSYPEVDIVFCTKDKKVDSRWESQKEQPADKSQEYLSGVLTPTQKYGPGSFIAISPDIQIDRWNADYDGDIVTFEAKEKHTQQFQLMSRSSNSTQYSVPKIPKTFTPPLLEDGSFSYFRFSSIVQSRTANLLTQYAKIYDVFIALKPEYQHIVATTIVNMPTTGKIIRCILVDEAAVNIQQMIINTPNLIILKVLSAGVKTGSDSFKSKVDWTYFREFGNIMTEVYHNLDIPTELVYFKRLCIEMHRRPMNFNKLMIETKYQSRFFDSLPMHVLYKTLAATPDYKMKRLSQLLFKQIETDETAMEIIRQEAKHRKMVHQRRGKKRTSVVLERLPKTPSSVVEPKSYKPSEKVAQDPSNISEETSKKTGWFETLINKILESSSFSKPETVIEETTVEQKEDAAYTLDDALNRLEQDDEIQINDTKGIPKVYAPLPMESILDNIELQKTILDKQMSREEKLSIRQNLNIPVSKESAPQKIFFTGTSIMDLDVLIGQVNDMATRLMHQKRGRSRGWLRALFKK